MSVRSEPPPARLTRSQALLVGVYAVCVIAGSVIAFASPTEVVDRNCSRSADQPDIEFCLEAQRFSQPRLLVAASIVLLALGMLAGGWAWRRWRRTVHSVAPVGIVDAPRAFAFRLRRRSALLVVAAWPVFAGLATSGSSTPEFIQGERTCETRPFGTADDAGVVPTVVACEQHSIETQRTEVTASAWSVPLLLVGITLLAGTTTWWFRAWRLERTLRKPQYSYVASAPE